MTIRNNLNVRTSMLNLTKSSFLCNDEGLRASMSLNSLPSWFKFKFDWDLIFFDCLRATFKIFPFVNIRNIRGNPNQTKKIGIAYLISIPSAEHECVRWYEYFTESHDNTDKQNDEIHTMTSSLRTLLLHMRTAYLSGVVMARYLSQLMKQRFSIEAELNQILPKSQM